MQNEQNKKRKSFRVCFFALTFSAAQHLRRRAVWWRGCSELGLCSQPWRKAEKRAQRQSEINRKAKMGFGGVLWEKGGSFGVIVKTVAVKAKRKFWKEKKKWKTLRLVARLVRTLDSECKMLSTYHRSDLKAT